MHEFSVISGELIRDIISSHRKEIMREVQQAYLTHEDGDSINPRSYFLRFPAKPDSRIIALPAYLGGDDAIVGIKWIASFPGNISSNLPRASAVIILNDYETGYPFALLEASQISAARTAASAVLAAQALTGRSEAVQISVVGAGIIGRSILEFFSAQKWTFGRVVIHDQVAEYAAAMEEYVTSRLGYSASTVNHLESALAGAQIVVLATTAAEPYIEEPEAFAPGTVVLNISLRDISPEIIVSSYNVLDDVEHCLNAGTSPHLAEQRYGHREFITGTLAQVIRRIAVTGADKPVIFSPFGLGVLDLAVGNLVYRVALASGRATAIPGFFAETRRW